MSHVEEQSSKRYMNYGLSSYLLNSISSRLLVKGDLCRAHVPAKSLRGVRIVVCQHSLTQNEAWKRVTWRQQRQIHCNQLETCL